MFHLAAIYAFWAPDPHLFAEVNVGGTLNVLEAVAAAGCERMVYTSTVGVLGVDDRAGGRPSDETSYPDIAHLFGSYKRTKYVAEHEVLRAAAQGAPLSIVLPTFPLGPGDRRPTPTGKLILDFLNGKMPAFVDTAMNVVHVDDLALGHVAALQRGANGRSYILGGENRSMQSILQVLADFTGLKAPTRQVPKAVALAAGVASQVVEGRLLRREPNVSIEAARMSTTHMVFDDTRARAEIGYTSRPAPDAIEDSARWFVDNGYVAAKRLARISLVSMRSVTRHENRRSAGHAAARRGSRGGAADGGRRLRRCLHLRGPARSVPAVDARGRAQRATRVDDRDRGRLREKPDDHRDDGLRPPAGVEGTLRSRAGNADQAPHREAVLDAVVASAPRMRELTLAVRAIWAAWNDRVPLDFRGEFYRHTLMTPFFDPGPNPFGVPRIVLAGWARS